MLNFDNLQKNFWFMNQILLSYYLFIKLWKFTFQIDFKRLIRFSVKWKSTSARRWTRRSRHRLYNRSIGWKLWHPWHAATGSHFQIMLTAAAGIMTIARSARRMAGIRIVGHISAGGRIGCFAAQAGSRRVAAGSSFPAATRFEGGQRGAAGTDTAFQTGNTRLTGPKIIKYNYFW